MYPWVAGYWIPGPSYPVVPKPKPKPKKKTQPWGDSGAPFAGPYPVDPLASPPKKKKKKKRKAKPKPKKEPHVDPREFDREV